MPRKEVHFKKVHEIESSVSLDGILVPDKSHFLEKSEVTGYENNSFIEKDIQNQEQNRSRRNGVSDTASVCQTSQSSHPESISFLPRPKEKRKPPPLDLSRISNLVSGIEMDSKVAVQPAVVGKCPPRQTTVESSVIQMPLSATNDKRSNSGPMLVGRRTTIKQLFRSCSRQQTSYDVTDDVPQIERPRSYFNLALFTCCCCCLHSDL